MIDFKVYNKGISDNNFPFPFLSSYSDFVFQYEKDTYFLFVSEDGLSIPAKVFKSSFLKVLKFLFPPVDGFGNRVLSSRENNFLNDLIVFIKKSSICDRILQGENFALFKTYPSNAVFCEFGTYVLDLNKNEEELFSNMRLNYRNEIRKAQEFAEINWGNLFLDEFYILYKETMNRSDMHCPDKSYFENLLSNMPNNVICGVVKYKDEYSGALFLLYSKYGAYYLYGASSSNSPMPGLIKLLHWEAIKRLKKNGVVIYDFVGARLSEVKGTKLDGIQKFKERFGSELQKGYLWKMDLNKSICVIYDFLLKIKLAVKGRRVPLDIIDQENKKIKNGQ